MNASLIYLTYCYFLQRGFRLLHLNVTFFLSTLTVIVAKRKENLITKRFIRLL